MKVYLQLITRQIIYIYLGPKENGRVGEYLEISGTLTPPTLMSSVFSTHPIAESINGSPIPLKKLLEN